MPATTQIRRYRPPDERSWLRCRVLSFLDTAYFDDVWTTRPNSPAIQLVAVTEGEVVGLLDVEIEGDLATIDTVAIHPDHQGRGIGTHLLEMARTQLPASVTTLDAWTRDDPATLAWYHRRGFEESEHYLHVYKGDAEPSEGWVTPAPLSSPITAFCHSSLEHESELRSRFARVHVCRRFSQPV